MGNKARKKLILTHRKDLNIGDFLVDDRTKNGAGEFMGEFIQFGTDKFPDWAACKGKFNGKKIELTTKNSSMVQYTATHILTICNEFKPV